MKSLFQIPIQYSTICIQVNRGGMGGRGDTKRRRRKPRWLSVDKWNRSPLLATCDGRAMATGPFLWHSSYCGAAAQRELPNHSWRCNAVFVHADLTLYLHLSVCLLFFSVPLVCLLFCISVSLLACFACLSVCVSANVFVCLSLCESQQAAQCWVRLEGWWKGNIC